MFHVKRYWYYHHDWGFYEFISFMLIIRKCRPLRGLLYFDKQAVRGDDLQLSWSNLVFARACWLSCTHYIAIREICLILICNYRDKIRALPIIQARWFSCTHYIAIREICLILIWNDRDKIRALPEHVGSPTLVISRYVRYVWYWFATIVIKYAVRQSSRNVGSLAFIKSRYANCAWH
jgi:hypothetical protein